MCMNFCVIENLGGGNSNIFYFHPENWGRWTHFDEHIFHKEASKSDISKLQLIITLPKTNSLLLKNGGPLESRRFRFWRPSSSVLGSVGVSWEGFPILRDTHVYILYTHSRKLNKQHLKSMPSPKGKDWLQFHEVRVLNTQTKIFQIGGVPTAAGNWSFGWERERKK